MTKEMINLLACLLIGALIGVLLAAITT